MLPNPPALPWNFKLLLSYHFKAKMRTKSTSIFIAVQVVLVIFTYIDIIE